MSISDDPAVQVDSDYEIAFVLFNAAPETVQFKLQGWQVAGIRLHPILAETGLAEQAGFDEVTQIFQVPGRSTVVFVGETQMETVDITEVAIEAGSEAQETDSTEAEETPQIVAEAATENLPAATEPIREKTTLPGWLIGALIGSAVVLIGGLAWRARKK